MWNNEDCKVIALGGTVKAVFCLKGFSTSAVLTSGQAKASCQVQWKQDKNSTYLQDWSTKLWDKQTASHIYPFSFLVDWTGCMKQYPLIWRTYLSNIVRTSGNTTYPRLLSTGKSYRITHSWWSHEFCCLSGLLEGVLLWFSCCHPC